MLIFNILDLFHNFKKQIYTIHVRTCGVLRAFLKKQAESCLIFCTKKNFFCTNFQKMSGRFWKDFGIK